MRVVRIDPHIRARSQVSSWYGQAMARTALALGEHGEIEITAQVKVSGRWVASKTRKAERQRARVYFRGYDGVRREVATTGKTKREATDALKARLAERLRDGDAAMTAGMPFVDAGRLWLASIARIDSGLSPRTIDDYSTTFDRYVDTEGSSLRGLTLKQANDPQRLRGFLQAVADNHGTGSAKMTRSVLMGVLRLAVDNGVLSNSAMPQVRPVKSQMTKEDPRDRERAMTREERDAVVKYADDLARELSLNPRTKRKRRATADLIAFMAGTGVRIEEARAQRWDDVNLATGACRIRGTKSTSSDRVVTLPAWLLTRLEERAATSGATGLVFPAPAHLSEPERPWDQSNSANAVRAVLDGAGFEWAVPHTFRRTVATLLHEAAVPLVRIADQLGHADPAMTARVYLGRDLEGDSSALAAVL